MVLLSMTASILAAIQKCAELDGECIGRFQRDGEPQLAEPEVGRPISHAQLVDISKFLKKHNEDRPESTRDTSIYLNDLLRGSSVYVPPPKSKQEPTSEYKTLMEKLRREEEARAYERMVNPKPSAETFAQHFAASPHAHAYPSATDLAREADEEITYADVNRQLAVIFNVLVSIVACSVAIWIAARHLEVPKRLGLSMGGSGVVAVAEVVIYQGYLGRMKEAKAKEKKKVEKKKVLGTWVIDGARRPNSAQEDASRNTRFRKGKHR
ncbi:endoplasmic reticulum-based factor for assembly of V-ATPase-domain-containing protein [Lineolata rhizophorae]|uniref:Endoplasmic reticulum-based factor for assembly of V-ATPase-domain-containing protein n=1 Tax=Lineolata rhizophorae TaxID=578093 RepID=A0A6A6NVB0_9PEZI|nr:endoplasmic reticulum-based factor for assembly of V-ATPase-domain-containing protein [Lineolata rhizophorae]